ncbi:unnamed protein product [Aspergillus oryzae RIB40]|uniref:DNA, SC038 n=2 Tax=Aspergillus oryzae TaxID=5062 RepID=Q2U301_ASPOR|nr:unnamed protein product [Aspergillus oryzae RIB40]EIT74644.1 hypothetical protein Ao3042_09393 [Aspergillus oryzae 3.042]KDE84523.1 hypothetical protein AO1008_11147 [Aspergillus oryzae 100-8]BAE64064.1 unnamed protein product [Aspergillus oryzae RIB40]|eukprot:EIT74644.1 hypothetical protein Ao3042_09393 [Aspergillus oryzae 3.042]
MDYLRGNLLRSVDALFPPSFRLQTPKEYYSSFNANSNLQEKFHNIDDEGQFRAYLGYLQDVQTRNFMLDFGNDDAWCAVDLEEEDIATLLRGVKPRFFGTRWM